MTEMMMNTIGEKENISSLDLVFCLDATGSMGRDLEYCKTTMLSMINKVAKDTDTDIKVGVTAYRDFTDAWIVKDMTDGRLVPVSEVGPMIRKLTAGGGADAPEAVLTGLAASLKYPWREHSLKYCILVGDAPQHGIPKYKEYDHYPQGEGITEDDVSSAFEKKGVIIHALCVHGHHDIPLEEAFAEFAAPTGGTVRAVTSSEGVTTVLTEAVQQLDLERRVFSMIVERNLHTSQMMDELGVSPQVIEAAKRGLVNRGVYYD